MHQVAGETKYATEVSVEGVTVAGLADTAVKTDKSGKVTHPSHKAHHEYLIKEMLWMQEDFERERKKKQGDAKK